VYDEGTLVAVLPAAADASATGSEAGAVAIVMAADESATLAEATALAAEPTVYPLEEALGAESGEVGAELACADDSGVGVDNAAWLPQGAYTVPFSLPDTVLDREFEILGK
jgi:hypothetical protein